MGLWDVPEVRVPVNQDVHFVLSDVGEEEGKAGINTIPVDTAWVRILCPGVLDPASSGVDLQIFSLVALEIYLLLAALDTSKIPTS